jgi:hypothetical protein
MDSFHGRRKIFFGRDTGARAHLQKINVFQDALCQCAMGYDTIDHGLWECGLHCALRNELQEKLRAAGIDHGRLIRDTIAMRNMVALRIIFEYSKDMVFFFFFLIKYSLQIVLNIS